MGTTIRAEVSKKNPYWIERHRYNAFFLLDGTPLQMSQYKTPGFCVRYYEESLTQMNPGKLLYLRYWRIIRGSLYFTITIMKGTFC